MIQTQSPLPSWATLLPGGHAREPFNTHQPQLHTQEVREAIFCQRKMSATQGTLSRNQISTVTQMPEVQAHTPHPLVTAAAVLGFPEPFSSSTKQK